MVKGATTVRIVCPVRLKSAGVKSTYENSLNGTDDTPAIAIGASFGSTSPIVPQDCHAVVVAKFSDGSEQVVLDRNF